MTKLTKSQESVLKILQSSKRVFKADEVVEKTGFVIRTVRNALVKLTKLGFLKRIPNLTDMRICLYIAI